jgi:hypothetical protein
MIRILLLKACLLPSSAVTHFSKFLTTDRCFSPLVQLPAIEMNCEDVHKCRLLNKKTEHKSHES